jgi:phospho-N-acetylmuramoyl-pentapeptide-transferase
VLYLLRHLHAEDSWRLVFNLFGYVTFRAACAALTAFLAGVTVMPWVIARLRRSRVLERVDNADSQRLTALHSHKAGTPTLGGVVLVGSALGAGVLWADLANRYVLLALGATLGLALVGLLDDLIKLRRAGRRRGMSARWKLALQIVVGAAVGGFLAFVECPTFEATRLTVPFFKPEILAPDLGVAYVAFAALVIVGSSNAVNLTDGLDGLAAGCSAVAAVSYAALAYLAGHARLADYLNLPFVRGAEELTILCAALGGATLGFLWYNAHPAEIFMGDTGSLAVGGLLATCACAAKHELLLALIGGVFVLEAGSVMLQVASFRLFGRRVFRIAPIHHHFQFKGWPENKIVVRFWIVAVILALLGAATLKVR